MERSNATASVNEMDNDEKWKDILIDDLITAINMPDNVIDTVPAMAPSTAQSHYASSAHLLQSSASLPTMPLQQIQAAQQQIEQQQQQQPQQQQQQQQLQQLAVSPRHISTPASPAATTSNAGRSQRGYIKIIEQPIEKGLRFRYICEGRSAGSIPGKHSSSENKTFPTIEIVGVKGEVIVVVSCVTKDEPYRQHPHRLVSKDGQCKDGICSIKLTQEPFRCVLSNVGIQCVKKKDIRESLIERENRKIDPFNEKFDHKNHPTSIDLNVVRLCFQAFYRGPNGVEALDPVVSTPIYEKKAHNDLTINRLCSCSAKVGGGDELILLCEKVTKDDISIRFFELNNDDEVIWEAIVQGEVHKQTGIVFKTPRYRSTDVKQSVKVFIQLYRPSDKHTSEPLPFEFRPDPGMRTFARLQRKLKRKQDLDIFQKILSLDSETTATKYSCPPIEMYDDEGNTVSSDDSASKPQSSATLNDYEAPLIKPPTEDYEPDDCEDTQDFAVGEDMEIELEVPQLMQQVTDDCTQTSTPMEEILLKPQLDTVEPRLLTNADKINEWMRSSEFERTDSLIVERNDSLVVEHNDSLVAENGDSLDTISMTNMCTPQTVFTQVSSVSANTTITNNLDEDKTLNERRTHSRRDTLENPAIKELPVASNGQIQPLPLDDAGELPVTASAQVSVDIDENFDETSTYTSLQIAYKNPIDMPHKSNAQNNRKASFIEEDAELVVLTNPPAPKIKVNAAQTPVTPPSPPLPLPPRTPSPVLEQKLPPLPPKPRNSQDLSVGEHSRSNSISINRSRNGSVSSARAPSHIVIMRTPDQSPTKQQAATAAAAANVVTMQSTPTASPKKRQGFFSRLFSRRKSKADVNDAASDASEQLNTKTTPKATTPTGSREPSIANFMLNDATRASVRSVKSMQQPSIMLGLSPQNSTKGKPVGRSSSSVSGRRPAYLDADVIHIPLKGGDSEHSLCQQENYSNASTLTYGRPLDRKTLSTLQLADIPISDGNMELVAIADRQSIKNLCEGAYGVVLDPSVDLSEAEHFALYTSKTPEDNEHVLGGNATGQMEPSEFLGPDEIARRLAEANGLQ